MWTYLPRSFKLAFLYNGIHIQSFVQNTKYFYVGKDFKFESSFD